MMISSLMTLGFTEYEAKVYLALLKDSPVSGYQISKNAGIPRSMVYEALGRLSTRGAIMKSESERAVLYRPIHPDVLLNKIETEHRMTVHELREQLGPIFQSTDENRLWSLDGRPSVIAYALQMITNTQTEISCVMGDLDLESLQEVLSKRYKSGVKLNLLLTGNANLSEIQFPTGPGLQVAIHPQKESEIQKLSRILIICTDEQECLIANKDRTGIGSQDSQDWETSATITNNRSLIFIVNQFVWMELFTQRIQTKIGEDLINRLDPEDRLLFGESETQSPQDREK